MKRRNLGYSVLLFLGVVLLLEGPRQVRRLPEFRLPDVDAQAQSTPSPPIRGMSKVMAPRKDPLVDQEGLEIELAIPREVSVHQLRRFMVETDSKLAILKTRRQRDGAIDVSEARLINGDGRVRSVEGLIEMREFLASSRDHMFVKLIDLGGPAYEVARAAGWRVAGGEELYLILAPAAVRRCRAIFEPPEAGRLRLVMVGRGLSAAIQVIGDER